MAITYTHQRESWQSSTQLVHSTNPFEWSDVDLFVIHYAGVANTPDGDPTDGTMPQWLRNTQNYYLNKVKPYSIGYNVAVDWQGRSWELRGEDFECAANQYVNGRSFACIIVTDGQDKATPAAVAEVNRLIGEAHKSAPKGVTILGHWQTTLPPYHQATSPGTDCPGVGIKAQLAAGEFRLPEAPPIFPPGTESSVLVAFYKLESKPYVYGVYPGGYKVWLPDPGSLAAAQALAKLGGKNDEIKVTRSADLLAAFGPIVGPVPPGCDPWGR